MSFSPIPSYVAGSAMTLFGALPLFAPRKDYEMFGLPLETTPPPLKSSEASPQASTPLIALSKIDGFHSPYVYAKGIRDLTYGLGYLILQAQGQDIAITTLTGLVALTGVVDGVIVWRCAGQELRSKAWAHFGTGALLAGWAAWRASYQ